MLNIVDFDLNSVQFCSDSLKQRLRRTMLNQECVFMGQVSELHRLYRTQVEMMNDFKLTDSNQHRFRTEDRNPIPLKLDNQGKGFRLPADAFIGKSTPDILGKREHEGSLKVSIDSKNYLNNSDLSLRIGQGTREKCSEHKSPMGKKTLASSSTIIDLEDPNFRFSNVAPHFGLKSGFVATKACSEDQHKLESFVNCDHHNLESFPKRKISHVAGGTSVSRSMIDFAPSFEEMLHVSGLNKKRDDMFSDFLSNNSVASQSATKFDLNVAYHEDYSYLSRDPSLVANPSGTSLPVLSDEVYSKSAVIPSVCPTSFRESNVNSCFKVSEIHVQNAVGSDLAHSSIVNFWEMCSKVGKSREDNRGKVSCINLNSDSDEELCSSRSDPKIESVGSSSKLSKGIAFEIDMNDVVGAGQGLQKDLSSSILPHSGLNQRAIEQLKRQKLSNSSDSECILDKPCTSVKTMQSGVKSRGFNCSSSDESQMVGVGPAAAHSRELDQRYSESLELNTGCVYGKESELDTAVQTAAELILQLSLETEPSYPSDLVKINSNEVHNKGCDQPQCSSESYEAMVLKAKESDSDDYSVSSHTVMVDEAESKNSRYKLKRGTRMKDFQKDILPGLSTLSRHEIREDMKIIEGVMKSREYRKMKGKMIDEGEWCRLSRMKRSRLNRR